MKKYALLSVYNKTGIVTFAQELVALGWSLIASGGTKKALDEAGLQVQDVADLVGGEAILGHRVVTLSREIHAGLLSRDTDEDNAELDCLAIPRIDLVCVDLYPLEDAIGAEGATTASVIEKTDVGGPTILRSAAKGRRIVICDRTDRARVLTWLEDGQPEKEAFITELTAKAEFVCSFYGMLSAAFHGGDNYAGLLGRKVFGCKYGENPWQQPAGFYSGFTDDPLSLDKFKLVKGASPSYNNVCDMDRALQTITHIAAALELNGYRGQAIAVAMKHGNACGAAFGEDSIEVIQRVVEGDPLAIMGGVVITNFELNDGMANLLREHKCTKKRPIDVVLAPSFTPEAIKALRRPNGACRRFVNPALIELGLHSINHSLHYRPVRGGFLLQPNYTYVLDLKDSELQVTGERLKNESALLLAWAVGSTSNSNSITVVHPDGYLMGNGTGQQSRVAAVKLSIDKALASGHDCRGAMLFSDSFFPFSDGPAEARKAGITTILTLSGSVKDQGVMAFCQESGITTYVIPNAKARGFYGH